MTVAAPSALERVHEALRSATGYEARGNGDWRCPAHEDKRPSLSVNQGDRAVVVKCQRGCSTPDVLAAVGLTMADLYDAPATNGTHKAEPLASYPYVDEHGDLLFEVVRFVPKDFRQRRPDGKGGWEWRLGDVRRVPYHLPALLEGVAAGRTVFVVEGEKDVHAVESAGGVATCNPGGAGKWRPEFGDFLVGADVVVVADRDPTGTKHAADVEASLLGKARRVRVVDPLTGKDAADHLAAGHTLADWTAVAHPKAFKRVLLGDIVRKGVPEPTMVHPWLYAGGLHAIQAEPGVGKTWLAAWLSMQLLEDGWHVVYLDEEGGDELVAERFEAMGADPDLLDTHLHYLPFPQRTWDDDDVEALRDMLSAIDGKVGLGVLDSLPDFLAAADKDEDRGKDVTRFVHRVLAPFREVGAALVVLDHLVKPKTDGQPKTRSRYSRGSGAKLGKTHLTILVEQPEEFDRGRSGRLRLWRTKDRRGYTNLPRLTDAGLDIAVTTGGGRVSFEFVPSEEERRETQSPTGFRPTYNMEMFSLELERQDPAPVSKRTLRSFGRGSNEIRDLGMDLLVAEGHAVLDRGGYRHFQPYRERWDPKSTKWEGEPVEPPW